MATLEVIRRFDLSEGSVGDSCHQQSFIEQAILFNRAFRPDDDEWPPGVFPPIPAGCRVLERRISSIRMADYNACLVKQVVESCYPPTAPFPPDGADGPHAVMG